LTEKFDVFLSYSRKDADFAGKLEKALRSYTPPKDLPVPHRRLTVFRDVTDMLGVELTEALDDKLRHTSKLVVLCSPDARTSPYVNEEIDFFASWRGPGHIIPVLVRGLPNNEAGQGQEREMSFPEALIKILPVPLAAEFRGFRSSKDRIGRHAYEQGWYKLLADLYSDYGVTRAQIEQREKRRRARLRAIATTLTGAVMVMLLSLTVWALVERREAIRQRNDAVSRQLAQQSTDLVAEKPDTALLLAAAADRNAPTLEARLSLESSFLARPRLRRFLWGHTGDIAQIAFSPDGRTFASVGQDDKRLVVSDVSTGATRFNVVGHPDAVQQVAFSPDGQRVISAGKDGSIRIWNAQNGTQVLSFGEPREGTFLNTFALSSDGLRLASAYWDGSISVWNVGTGLKLASVNPHQGIVTAVAFSADGKTIASGSDDGTAALWDGNGEHHPMILTGHDHGVHDVVLNSEGTVLAVAHGAGLVNLWSVQSGLLLVALRSNAPGHDVSERVSLGFAPDGKAIALAGALTEAISVWDLATSPPEERVVPTGSKFGVHAVAFNHAGGIFAAVTGEGGVLLWETAHWALAEGSNGGTNCLAFSPDDALLATCGQDRAALWDVNEPDLIAALQSHQERVGALRFSPDGTYLASASQGRDVSVWNVRTRRQVAIHEIPKSPSADFEPVTHGKELRVFAFSPDGRTIATGGRQGRSFGEGGRLGDLLLWNFAGDKSATPLDGHRSGIAALVFSPDGRQLAVADGSTVRLWDLETHKARMLSETGGALCLAFDRAGERLAAGSADSVLVWDVRASADEAQPQPVTLRGHERPVRQILFSPDGRRLLSGSFDGTVRIWNLSRPDKQTPVAIVRHSGDINSLDLSADGHILATASRDQTVGLWDAATGAILHRLTGHNSEVESVSLTRNGEVVASAAQDGSAMLWDVKTGREILTLRRSATLVAFSPTGPLLATAGGPSHRVTLWNVSMDMWADRACSIANRNFTCDEWRQYMADSRYQPVCPRLPSPRECAVGK
jgi:WD40 repeat protein